MTLKGKDIICVSTSDWGCSWGSKQHLMSRLSANNRVFYVEYQSNLLHLFKRGYWKKLLNAFGKISKLNENLFIYTPPFYLLPWGYYFRFVNKLNQALLYSAMMKEMKKIGFDPSIAWVYPPIAIDLVKYMKGIFLVYHCIADFSIEKRNLLRRHTTIRMEDELAKLSDLLFALTKTLCIRYSKLNKNVVFFPSAVDIELFNKIPMEQELPKDIKDIKKPIIGLVGYLDDRVLDIDILEHMSLEKPDWSLVLIGPILRGSRSFSKLQKIRNVHFLGPKTHLDIPSYVRFFDVCLIPYQKNKFMENVSPLKLYEYLALGKPVVSTDFSEEVRGIDDIFVAKDKEDFIRCIKKALESKSEADPIKRRKDIASKNSWDARMGLVLSKFES
ncbi:MAG: glycosyltransferase [Candidatus Omnitrophota bacterium]|jgi:glycosyltransferase involved in cell wall biosynthesis